MTSVLVVDDSRFMRTVLERQLSEEGYTVYTARNGKRAVTAVEKHNPDVVTMDVQMPKMNGIEAVERIMSRHPVPIVMLSAHTKEDAEITLNALEKGAVDVLMKPDGREVSMDAEDIIDQLTETIDAVAGIDVESASETRSQSSGKWFFNSPGIERYTEDELEGTPCSYPTIIIGASTGGPSLLESIMRDLPVSLHARVIIVQHMPKNFTERLAQRLDATSSYTVKEGSECSSVGPNEAVVAPGDKHLTITGDVDDELLIDLDDSGPVNSITPSIDVTMVSAAPSVKPPMVAVALTGMGKDGAEGVKAIKGEGGYTIAQDEETSTVFGIPARAIDTGCVDKIVPDTNIVSGIVDTLTSTGDSTHG